MDVATVLLTVVVAALMFGVGLLVGRYRAEATGRAAVSGTEAAGRAALAQAEARGREAVAQAEAQGRESVGRAEAATHEAAREVARLTAILDSERASHRRRLEEDAVAESRLREAFDSLAGKALQANNQAFAELAEAKLTAAKSSSDGDLAQRQQAIEGMVLPLRETLERVQTQLNSVERDRTGSYEKLMEQVGSMSRTSEQLRTETAQLVTALRAPQVRGAWGEMQLRRTVEAAGMTEHIDFVEQASVQGDEGKLRPDMVVQLVGGKNVVVDSKVAFSRLPRGHGGQGRGHPGRPAQGPRQAPAHAHRPARRPRPTGSTSPPRPSSSSASCPADAFLDAALREDPTLLERAFDQDVVIATPSTLVALLRTVAYTWRQEALAANAAEVHQLGRELYQRLSTMGGHIDKLGSSRSPVRSAPTTRRCPRWRAGCSSPPAR